MEPIPLFAVIVPIAHSIEDLRRCLESFNALDYDRDKFQVVLVDCKVVEGVEKFLNKTLAEYGFRVTTLYLPDKPSTWFIEARVNEARNYAMKMVRGRYYVFTVDDCTFEPDWLSKFEVSLSDGAGALGGPDILPQGMDSFSRAVDCVLNSFLGTGTRRKGEGRRTHSYYPRKENMAIPADVIDRAGSFLKKIRLQQRWIWRNAFVLSI